MSRSKLFSGHVWRMRAAAAVVVMFGLALTALAAASSGSSPTPGMIVYPDLTPVEPPLKSHPLLTALTDGAGVKQITSRGPGWDVEPRWVRRWGTGRVHTCRITWYWIDDLGCERGWGRAASGEQGAFVCGAREMVAGRQLDRLSGASPFGSRGARDGATYVCGSCDPTARVSESSTPAAHWVTQSCSLDLAMLGVGRLTGS